MAISLIVCIVGAIAYVIGNLADGLLAEEVTELGRGFAWMYACNGFCQPG